MLIGSLVGWIIAGLIVGATARLILPGRQDIGIAMTIVLGIVGAMFAGFLSTLMFGPRLVTDGTQVYALETAWPGWIMAILGGVAVLWLATFILGSRDRRS